MKKLFLLTIALVAMTASATEYNYDWASTSGAKAIYYKLNYPVSGEATVVAGEWEYRDDVVIPDEITVGGNTYLVTTIGYHAFYYCSDVSSVTLGANVKTIQSYAFERVSGPNSTGMVININSDALTTIGYTPAKGAKYADGTTAGDPAAAFHVVTIGPNKGKDTLAIGKNVAGLSGRNNYFSWVTFKNVKHYYVDPTSETLSVDADGVLYNANKSKLYLHHSHIYTKHLKSQRQFITWHRSPFIAWEAVLKRKMVKRILFI